MNEALEKLLGTLCEVLISDIELPDGDGWEPLRKLSALKPFVPYELDRALAEAAREIAKPEGSQTGVV